MRVTFGQSNFPEMIDKSNFRACTCKQFGGKKHTDIEKKNTDLIVWIYSGKCMLIVAKRSIKVELQQGGQKKVR